MRFGLGVVNTNLLKEFGPFVVFNYPSVDGSGFSKNQLVYSDIDGTIYAYGTGPLNNYNPANAVVTSQASYSIPSNNVESDSVGAIIQSPVSSSWLSSLESNPVAANAISILTGSVIGGIPNWMILGAVVLGFMFFGEEKGSRRK